MKTRKTTEPLAKLAETEPRQTRGAATLEDHRAARAGTLEDARRISPGLLLGDCTRAARRWTKGVRKSEIETVASEVMLRLMVRQLCRESVELRGELSKLTLERERELMAERGGRLPRIRDWYRDAYNAPRTGDNRSELALSELRNAVSAVVKNRARWSETPAAEDLELSLDRPDSPVAQLAAKESLETERGTELLPDASASELASALGMPLNAGRTIERVVSGWSAREAAAVWNVSESRAEKSQSAGLSYLRSARGWQDPDVMRNALWAARAVLRADSRRALKTELAALVREDRYQTRRALRGELAAVSLELAETARRAAIHWHGLQLTSASWRELAERSAALWIDAAKLRGYRELRGGSSGTVPTERAGDWTLVSRWSGRRARVETVDGRETERETIAATLAAGAAKDALRTAAVAERAAGDWTGRASVELETVTWSALVSQWRERELDNAYAASFKGGPTPLRAIDAATWADIVARRELAEDGGEDGES